MRTGPGDIRLPGAVDLSALRTPARAPGPAGESTGSSSAHVIDVTEASFATDVVERSRQVPVVIDFWASWCGPCRQLSPVLEKLAAEGGGEWILAKIDVDANQRIAAAAGVQGIPAVKAVVNGAIVSEFTGALPEAQVRQWLGQILAYAQSQAQSGAAESAGGAAAGAAPPAEDPAYAEADEAVGRGDLPAALAAYRRILEANPADDIARTAVARLELLVRTQTTDERAVRAAGDAKPDDVDAQIAVADLDMAVGQVDAALARLLGVVRRADGAERDRARGHLIELFDVLDPDDARLAAARRELANALF